MKKVLMISLLSTAAMMMFATSADAVEPKVDKSDVGVSFKSDDSTIIGDHKPFSNNLALVWKPGSFEFGEQKAVGAIATFNNSVEGEQYLVVNDDRPDADLSTWELKAQLSDMAAEDGTKLTSKLVYGLGELKGYDIGDLDEDTNDFNPKNPATDTTSLIDLPANSKVELGGTTMTLEAGNTTAQTVMKKTEATKIKGGYATLVNKVKLVATDAKKDLAAGKSFTGQVSWTVDNLQP